MSAAHFVQNVMSSYERHYDALQHGQHGESGTTDMQQSSTVTEGKECSNLIVLLSELYNFQVISCVLVFDLIRTLLDGSISEFNVELLLKIMRSTLFSMLNRAFLNFFQRRFGTATTSG